MQPDQNQYDFIMDPSQQGSSSGPSFLKNPNQRTIIAAIFVVVIIILAIAAIGFISSLNKQDNSSMVNVAAYQAEMIRVVDLGLLESKDPNTLAQLGTMRAFLQTDAAAVSAYFTAQGEPLSKPLLASKKDSKIDKALESASQRNAYDEVLLSTIQSLGSKYKTSLQTAMNEKSPSPVRNELLTKSAQNILVFEGVAN